MDSSTIALWTGLFSIGRVSGWFFLLTYFIEIPVLNAYSIVLDYTPHSMSSDPSKLYANVHFMGCQT